MRNVDEFYEGKVKISAGKFEGVNRSTELLDREDGSAGGTEDEFG